MRKIQAAREYKHIEPDSSMADVPIVDVVRQTVEAIIGTPVPDDTLLMDAGLDSLSAAELLSTLGRKLNIEIEPMVLFDNPTIGDLGNRLEERIK